MVKSLNLKFLVLFFGSVVVACGSSVLAAGEGRDFVTQPTLGPSQAEPTVSEKVTPFVRFWAEEIAKISASTVAGKQLAAEHADEMIRADKERLARLQRSYRTHLRLCQGAGAIVGLCAGLGAQHLLGFQIGTDSLEFAASYIGGPAVGIWAAGRAYRGAGSEPVLSPNADGEAVLKNFENRLAELTREVGDKIRQMRELQSAGVWTLETLDKNTRLIRSLEFLSIQSLIVWSDAQMEMQLELIESPDVDRYMKRVHARISKFSDDFERVRVEAISSVTEEVAERFKIDLPKMKLEIAAESRQNCARLTERLSESGLDSTLYGAHLDH